MICGQTHFCCSGIHTNLYFIFAEDSMEHVSLNSDWFEEDEKLRTDESKRQNKSQDSFSIQGSFKKLDID